MNFLFWFTHAWVSLTTALGHAIGDPCLRGALRVRDDERGEGGAGWRPPLRGVPCPWRVHRHRRVEVNELRNNDLLASPKHKNDEQIDTNGDKRTSNSLHKAEDSKESVKNDGNNSENDTEKIKNVVVISLVAISISFEGFRKKMHG